MRRTIDSPKISRDAGWLTAVHARIPPDAAQYAAFAAWCAADPGSIGVGPGSAEQRYTLHRVRDTRSEGSTHHTGWRCDMAPDKRKPGARPGF